MEKSTVGIIILVISTLGYISNWINWRFLNYKINHLLYFFGAFIHESSHAILCILTGAKISEYKVFSQQPRVVYNKPKLPLIGNLLISIAPIFGGLILLFFVNKYFLENIYLMPQFLSWNFLFSDLLFLVKQINLVDWKTYITIFLFLNIGAMISPSPRDLKNVWFFIIILVFIPWPFFVHLGFLAVSLVLINIIIQLALIVIIYAVKLLGKVSGLSK